MTRLPTLLLLIAACSAPRHECRETATAPEPVFLVHGIWPDDDGGWAAEVEETLETRGIEAVSVRYSAFVVEFLFGFGPERVAERIATFARELEVRHAWTGCRAPLRFRGIGYSAGTVALHEAAERGVRFETLWFAGSPLPFWTHSLGPIVNYWSPLDGVVWVRLGAGQFGLTEARENRLHWRHHLMPVWKSEGEVDRVISELLSRPPGTPHTCLSVPWFAVWYRAAKRELSR